MASLRVARTGAGPVQDLSTALPGDKSISHRLLLVSALAERPVEIFGLNRGHSVAVLIDALRALGVALHERPDSLAVGRFPEELETTPPVLSFGGSSAAARLTAGILAGLGRPAIIDGDATLRARPMQWIVDPLRLLGAHIDYLDEQGRLPIRISPARLHGGQVRMAVASAQAKSAVMLAAVAAGVTVDIHCEALSRDHTERLLTACGQPLEIGHNSVRVTGVPVVPPERITVPRDPSAAAYPAAAHILLRRTTPLTLRGLSVNPTRIGFFNLLSACGASVAVERRCDMAGEPVGDISVRRNGPLRPFHVAGADAVHAMIDEIPLACALATAAEGASRIEGAHELTFKETDRLVTTRAMLSAFGSEARIDCHSIECQGGAKLFSGVVPGFGDHRIAMTAATLAGTLTGTSHISDGDCFATSFPCFPDVMSSVGIEVEIC